MSRPVTESGFVRCWLTLAAVFAMLAVAAGAFGAHGLRDVLSDRYLEVYQTAVSYQMYHALALGLTAVAAMHLGVDRILRVTAWSFALGVLVFSGSLYALVFTGMGRFGMITPVGGVAFIIGWLCLAVAAWRGA